MNILEKRGCPWQLMFCLQKILKVFYKNRSTIIYIISRCDQYVLDTYSNTNKERLS